jgi:3-oxoacyl-[acyl-carrier-protein] synthase-3
MPGLTILGTGSYTPPLSLTNEMLETIVDTNNEWIALRTGIHSRAIAPPEDTTLSMAAAAARGALESSDKSQIGVVIAATITPDYLTPSLSCLLQRDLELPGDVIAMDINCACSGFVMGLKTAYALLADMPGRTALVIGAEMLSRATDYTDRSTCILFGDGAGAAVIRRGDGGEFAFDGGARGNSELLYCKAQYLCGNPFAPRPLDAKPGAIDMNGQEVFRFALEVCSDSVSRVLARAGAAIDGVQHFIFHQANRRIIDGIIRRLGIEAEKCIVNIENHGNTSSASIAIALDELFRSGAVTPGDRLVLSAFGGGLTYASVYFTQGRA